MNCIKHFADVDTPTPGPVWLAFTDKQRMDALSNALAHSSDRFKNQIRLVATKADGQVILQLNEDIAANLRGPLLLDFEAYLKDTIDPALTVWLEPLGDRSSLRNLRGIEVKS